MALSGHITITFIASENISLIIVKRARWLIIMIYSHNYIEQLLESIVQQYLLKLYIFVDVVSLTVFCVICPLCVCCYYICQYAIAGLLLNHNYTDPIHMTHIPFTFQ